MFRRWCALQRQSRRLISFTSQSKPASPASPASPESSSSSSNSRALNGGGGGGETTAATKGSQITLHPPPSLRHLSNRIAIIPPEGAAPPAPAWMLKYFPQFFQPDDPSKVGPEEHHHPFGVMGVYGYLAMLVITGGLVVAHVYERFFTDTIQNARAAIREQMIREEVKRLERERAAEHVLVVTSTTSD